GVGKEVEVKWEDGKEAAEEAEEGWEDAEYSEEERDRYVEEAERTGERPWVPYNLEQLKQSEPKKSWTERARSIFR
ncbi:MAG: hypothetical protein Q9170_008299, partial [Blastenia crenularia]